MQGDVHSNVQEYYGKTLQTSSDLKTDACCTSASLPDYAKKIMGQIHDEVLMKYYGCGLILPKHLEGKTVLDLGSGSGRDCYILSKLVGENGRVIGVDMTDEQLEVANRHLEYHQKAFDYKKSNVNFIKGTLEELDQLGLEPGSIDVVVSNCVINLVKDKEKVLGHIFKLLKEGGELYFSDVYSDRRVPQELKDDPVLYGECLSGALYWNDFLRISKTVGFQDPRKVEDEPLQILNKEIQKKLGNIKFYSATYRLFKISELETDCEDYGQAIRYKGGIENSEERFNLDDHHEFVKNKIYPVCGNTYLMLERSRFSEHFDYFGDWTTHYGIFPDCGKPLPFSAGKSSSDNAQSCC
ncbi:MAG: methyltransferase domain-containing protein [Bacteriovoracaceae bacterium]